MRDEPHEPSTSPDQPERVNHSASVPLAGGKPAGRARRAVVPAVVTETVTDAAVEPWSATEFDEREHADCDGAPLHVSNTV